MQFHPEVVHTPRGQDILDNFVHGVCGCGRDRGRCATTSTRRSRTSAQQVGKDKVILGLLRRRGFQRRGGAPAQGHRRPAHLHLRRTTACCAHGEAERRAGGVRRSTSTSTCSTRTPPRCFLDAAQGRHRPRDASARSSASAFIDVFEAASRSKRRRARKFLAQGTLYPDVIEIVPIAGNPARDDQEPPQRRRPARRT
jgi:GMP synthase (glutamine-hydrolysing)